MRKLLALATVLAVVLTVVGVWGGTALAKGNACDATVVAPDSIQAAVVAATVGDKICLSGTFNQSVTIDKDGITLTSASTAILDGTGLPTVGSNFGITIAAGVSGVTIKDLEIRNYVGDGGGSDRSSAIVAAFGDTSDITVKNTHLHDNFWNGLLVWSNGGPPNHTDWTVKENTVENNGFINIEVTNCDGCKVKENIVIGAVVGIVVQARNDGQSGTVTQVDVRVEENKVSGAFWGILAQAFGVSSGDNAVLENVRVEENEVSDSGANGIYVRGRAGSGGTSEVRDVRVKENDVSGSGGNGIYLQEVDTGTVVTGNTVSENVVSGSGTLDCIDNTSGGGTAGTANTWTENEGATSSPTGLCD